MSKVAKEGKLVKYPNLRAEMVRNGVTREMLAEHAGCTSRTVDNWLCGARDIPVIACFRIRDELFDGMTVDYLFNENPLPPSL